MAVENIKKNIIENNRDLESRMTKESWKATYDKKSDTLIVGTKFPKNSSNVYVNEKEGSIIRVGEDNKIYGFVFENYKSVFLRENEHAFIFLLLFLPETTNFGWLWRIAINCCFYVYFRYVKMMNNLEEYRNKLLINNEFRANNYI